MNCCYSDFARLAGLTQVGVFFVIRAKPNLQSCVRDRRSVDRSSGLGCDQSINLSELYSRQDYPDLLRRICYTATDHEHTLVFLTNNFTLLAIKIAQIYESRWQIELFFRWLKQHLRIRSYVGTSANAVRIKI
jgi:IS4 transposase